MSPIYLNEILTLKIFSGVQCHSHWRSEILSGHTPITLLSVIVPLVHFDVIMSFKLSFCSSIYKMIKT